MSHPASGPNVIAAASGSDHSWDIVDAQIHFSRHNIGPALFAMDALGIRSAVIGEYWGNRADGTSMPSYRLPNGAIRALAPTATAAALEHPDRFSFFLRVDYLDPALEEVVSQVSRTPGGRGLRLAFIGPSLAHRAAFADGDFAPVFAAALTHRLPVFVLNPGRARDIASYAAQFPDVTIILDHIGMPAPDEDGAIDFEAYDEVLQLAAYPNVAMKWSHAPHLFGIRDYPFDGLDPLLRRAVDAFGAERLMWASDISMNTTGNSWAELLFYLRESPSLTTSEKQWILGRTARTLLDWPRHADEPGWTD